jgi:hypothetical protein
MRFTRIWLVFALMAAGTAVLAATGLGQQATAPANEKAFAEFQAAIADYMKLRQRLRNEITGPVAGSTAVELNRASDSLAAAIQRARAGARVGNIFAVPITVAFKHRVDEVVRQDNLAPLLAIIDDEPPTIKTPAIHLRFPAASQMATMPPSLLAALPELPKELEYRIVGEYLVLRDVDAALILDYIPAAVPRKPQK